MKLQPKIVKEPINEIDILHNLQVIEELDVAIARMKKKGTKRSRNENRADKKFRITNQKMPIRNVQQLHKINQNSNMEKKSSNSTNKTLYTTHGGRKYLVVT